MSPILPDPAGRSLLGLSWGSIAGALLLMWLGHPVAMLAPYPAVGYWVSYYLGRSTARLTAP